ncbi:SDR family NAD(P)-dependent oxidoreductase [Burkholderia sp. Ac-20379]|uniref:SDR family NAD(P)-dependent oxidoreductase n=1 Tax=Burkholderia sp. Ac-20379 TaxID=2703900 RepID=UPI001980A75E|nr:SDR family NAD(P)-dependent oxidoreductase [Burkholderia sp. Ac-20379]MBN3725150.1 SDR family oxidoreductase [Burkholderia sp. Ac-20379]
MSDSQSSQRIALVTGGAGGIGVAICRALAAAGHRVAVTDLQLDAARRVAESLPGQGHGAFALNVASEADVQAAFDAVTAQLGRPEILVHSAGILHFKPDGDRPLVIETSLADWQRNVDINQTGCFLVCREYARRLPAGQSFGRVVTLSSVAAQLGGYRSNAAYIASKAAVLGLTKALARELAPQGVTVNAVAPGMIDAPMLRLSLPPEKDATAAAAIPLNRLGLPEDVAAAVVHLVSPEASYQTGTTVDVNGGYRMQ